MSANAGAARGINYHTGEGQSRRVTFGELRTRALGVLQQLQQLGARPGDKLILLLNNNEQFIEAFWAALLGGIVPVPVAVGISDEHRHKLLRIAHKLGTPYICTDRKTLERVGQYVSQSADPASSATYGALRPRAILVEDLVQGGPAGEIHHSRPEDIAFIQFSSGSTSDPKGVVLTHANLVAHCASVNQTAGFTPEDVSLSWMPLTHDMGLIGFHLVMFAAQIETHLMPTELYVRRPLLWLNIASEQSRHHPVLAELRLPPLPEGAGRSLARADRPFGRAAHLQWRRAHFTGAVRRIHGPAVLGRPQAQCDVPGVRPCRSIAGREFSAAGTRVARAGAESPCAQYR